MLKKAQAASAKTIFPKKGAAPKKTVATNIKKAG